MKNQLINRINKNYVKKGYCVVDLVNTKTLKKLRSSLENEISMLVKSNKKVDLKNYHKIIDDKIHEKVQWHLCNYFRKKKFCHTIASEQIDLLRQIIGTDLLVQRDPFLRIARPGKETDNIGFHRDTVYGQSPYEISILITLVDLNPKECLKYLPYSHLKSDRKFKFLELETSSVQKGSKKHKLGFPYSPKIPKIKSTDFNSPSLKFGQAIIFSPSIVHGQKINQGKSTRFSFDFRVVNKFAPINIQTKTNRGYETLTESGIQIVAEKFLRINK